MSKISTATAPAWRNSETFPYNYKAMKNLILPRLTEIYKDINKRFDNALVHMAILRNMATGNYIDVMFDSHQNRFSFEVCVKLGENTLAQTNEIYLAICDEVEKIQMPGVVYYHLRSQDERIFCINLNDANKYHRSLVIGSNTSPHKIITFKEISEAEDKTSMLNLWIQQNTHYTWEQKKVSLSECPAVAMLSAHDRLVYAGIVHLWTKTNYLDVPAWVYEPPFVLQNIPNKPQHTLVPDEFFYRGLQLSESDFINI